MINLSNTNLLAMGRNEALEITKQELEEYKEARIYNQVSSNLPRLKNLEALDKRLGYFAVGDIEVNEVRNEVKQLLNEDVYKKVTPQDRILSSYEIQQNQRKEYERASKERSTLYNQAYNIYR